MNKLKKQSGILGYGTVIQTRLKRREQKEKRAVVVDEPAVRG